MSLESGAWTDRRVDNLLGHVLRAGVTLSGLVILLGGVVFLARHGAEIRDYRAFQGEPAAFRTIPGIMSEARQFSGRGLIQLGILCLVATPIARVAFSVIGFLLQRDWLYVALTLFVLGLLAYSLLGGLS